MRSFSEARPSLLIAMALLTAAACLAAPAPADPADLLRQAELSYSVRDKDTCEVQVQGDGARHTLIVRRVEGVLGVWCTPLAVPAEKVPIGIWRYLADLNTQSRMAHVGYTEGYFVVVTGHELGKTTPQLLKLMVTDVALVSDQLLPELKKRLATE